MEGFEICYNRKNKRSTQKKSTFTMSNDKINWQNQRPENVIPEDQINFRLPVQWKGKHW